MEIIFKGRQTDVPARFREYATAKLNKLEKLDQKAIRVDVEVSVERNPRLASHKERVELTIRSRGPAIRAEAAAEDRVSALDLALGKLDSRLRRALDRRKRHHGAGINTIAVAPQIPETRAPRDSERPRGGVSDARAPGSSKRPRGGMTAARASGRTARPRGGVSDARAWEATEPQTVGDPATTAADDAGPDSVVPIQMEGDGPLVVRQKFHHAKPISIDQALFEMELVGHDFYLFHDVEADAPSVVYRRHGYQYGVIRLVEDPAAAGPVTEPAAGFGAKIPGRRRPEPGRTRGRRPSSEEAATPAHAGAMADGDGQSGRRSAGRRGGSPALGTGQ